MKVSMSDYLTVKIDGVFDRFDSKKSYIILFNVDQIPPHLGFVTANRYYSLTFDDCQMDEPIRPILTYFRRGKNKCLVIELTDFYKKNDVEEVFGEFAALKDGKTTCLFPIKKILGFNNGKVKFIYDLIPELLDDKKAFAFKGVNFNDGRNAVSIFKYSMKAIQDRIKELNEYGKE